MRDPVLVEAGIRLQVALLRELAVFKSALRRESIWQRAIPAELLAAPRVAHFPAPTRAPLWG